MQRNEACIGVGETLLPCDFAAPDHLLQLQTFSRFIWNEASPVAAQWSRFPLSAPVIRVEMTVTSSRRWPLVSSKTIPAIAS